MLISFTPDETLLPRCVISSTIWCRDGIILLKTHKLYFMKTSASRWLLLVIRLGFDSGRCIYEMCWIIYVFCIHNSFCGISFASWTFLVCINFLLIDLVLNQCRIKNRKNEKKKHVWMMKEGECWQNLN